MNVQTLAALVGGTVEGDGAVVIRRLAGVEDAQAGDLTFATDERRAGKLSACQASAAIVGAAPSTAPMTLIRVADVQTAMATLLAHLAGSEDLPAQGIHPTAVIAADVSIGQNVAIGPHVTIGRGAVLGDGCSLCAGVHIGENVTLGEGCTLFEGVVIRWGCRLGRRVRVGPNSVIGYDGFGYHFADGKHCKFAHVGDVVIADDVELGACSCIDRAKFGSTFVGDGTKIDNLVQVAHNVRIGRGCLLCALCGVAGSTQLEDYVVLGGHCGLRDNIALGRGAQCAAFSAVAGDVEAGQVVAGVPADSARDTLRRVQAAKKLPDLLKTVRQLEARLEALESATNHTSDR